MKNLVSKSIIIVSLAGLTLLGCKKKSEDPAPVSLPQNLTLKFNPYKGDTALSFAKTFRAGNTRFNLSMFRYYVSNIKLVKNDGSEYALANKYLLVTPNLEDYLLGEVPAGEYTGIKYSIGIDSATNHKDPTVYSANNPLAIQSPTIHWSWNSGYIFMMLEGTCDTTVSNNDALNFGKFSHGLAFHIGMDKFLKQVNLTKSFSIATKPETISIKTDIDKLFTGIDLKKENTTHTMNNMPLAMKAANNIPSMFSIK